MNIFDLSKLPPVQKDNTLECVLHPETRTLPIFDEFANKKYSYLLIKWYGRFKTKIRFHLLVSKIPFQTEIPNLLYSSVNLTPTYLKDRWLCIKSKKHISELTGLKCLAQEVYNTLYDKDVKSNDIVYFDNAVAFEAQDTAYRSGFGMPRFSNNPDDNQLYGEGRKFAIIGVFIV